MLRNNWFRGYCQSNEEPNVAQMSIQNLSGLYIMVRVGVVVALIDFFADKNKHRTVEITAGHITCL